MSLPSTAPILITCARRIAPYLADEVRALGLPVRQELESVVETEGDFRTAMRLNLHVRTGLRVLFQLSDFVAADGDALYESLVELPWEEVIPADGYFSVHSYVRNDTIFNDQYANVRVKDAVVDRLVASTGGQRPMTGANRDRTVLFLYWHGDQASIFLDTSGEPLSRRGYRRIPGPAPLQETLAAAIIAASGWQVDQPFVNPMCGSGTLAIEAAMIACRVAPGLLRHNFGFMHCLGYDAAIWRELTLEARQARIYETPAPIIASDIELRAIEASKKNEECASLRHNITYQVCDFKQTTVPPGPGVVIFNPEYGERLGEVSELYEVYREIGDFFKQSCAGYHGFVFTGSLELSRQIGLRSDKRTPFFNGKLECRLVEFELYAGSRREPLVPPAAAADSATEVTTEAVAEATTDAPAGPVAANTETDAIPAPASSPEPTQVEGASPEASPVPASEDAAGPATETPSVPISPAAPASGTAT